MGSAHQRERLLGGAEKSRVYPGGMTGQQVLLAVLSVLLCAAGASLITFTALPWGGVAGWSLSVLGIIAWGFLMTRASHRS